MVNQYVVTIGAAAATGLARAVVGYVGNVKKEEFDFFKFFQAVFIGLVVGGLAGAITSDVKTAIIGALSGDVFVKAGLSFAEKSEKKV